MRRSGFTIVELLIVVVVIAILAAITIVSYNGITSRAHKTTVQSDFANIAKKAESYKTTSTVMLYPTGIATMQAAGFAFSKGSYNGAIWCFNNSSGAWAIVGDAKDGKSYYLNNLTNTFTEYSGTVVGVSGGDTRPNVGVTGATWTWLLQTPGGTWTY